MARAAARYDHYYLCEFALARAIDPSVLVMGAIFIGAAKGGHREICERAHDYTREHCEHEGCITNMIYGAIVGGHLDLVELALHWLHGTRVSIDYKNFIRVAARKGNIQMCKAIREWSGYISKQKMLRLMLCDAVLKDQFHVIEYITERMPSARVAAKLAKMIIARVNPFANYCTFSIFHNWACENDAAHIVEDAFDRALRTFNTHHFVPVVRRIIDVYPDLCKRHVDALLQFAVETNSTLCAFACECGARPTYKHLARAVRISHVIALMQLLDWFMQHHMRIRWSKLLVCAARNGCMHMYNFLRASMKRYHVIRGPRASYASLLRATFAGQSRHKYLFDLILAQMREDNAELSDRDASCIRALASRYDD
jgi:hypothetical protein